MVKRMTITKGRERERRAPRLDIHNPLIFLKPSNSSLYISLFIYTFFFSHTHTHTHFCSPLSDQQIKWRRRYWDRSSLGASAHLRHWGRRRMYRAVASHRSRRRNGRSPSWGPPEGSVSPYLFSWSSILLSRISLSTISPALPVSLLTSATLTPDPRSCALPLSKFLVEISDWSLTFPLLI